MNSGKKLRLARIMNPKTGRMLVVPVDDSLLAGPSGNLLALSETVATVASAGADAVLGFSGIYRASIEPFRTTGSILNLTASTTKSNHTRKVQIGTVEQAVQLGADCVAVHVNVSSVYEGEMLSIMGNISIDCSRFGMPLMGIIYPRREQNGQDDNYEDLRDTNPEKYKELVCHAVRIGVELGADIIKTPYTGNVNTFSEVLYSAMGVPILIAGGPLVEKEVALDKARSAIAAGASGISFGRNVFMREKKEMAGFVKDLRKIVHSDAG